MPRTTRLTTIRIRTLLPWTASKQARILADDRLIEAIRTGRITDADHVEPVARLLAQWRSHVIAGT